MTLHQINMNLFIYFDVRSVSSLGFYLVFNMQYIFKGLLEIFLVFVVNLMNKKVTSVKILFQPQILEKLYS